MRATPHAVLTSQWFLGHLRSTDTSHGSHDVLLNYKAQIFADPKPVFSRAQLERLLGLWSLVFPKEWFVLKH